MTAASGYPRRRPLRARPVKAIKHIVMSHSACTVVWRDGYMTTTAPMRRDKNDREAWPDLCMALGFSHFASIREFATQHGIPIYEGRPS